MRKFVALLLILCISTSLIIPAYAAEQEFPLLYDLGIFVGDGDGNMRWNDSVTRAEFGKLVVSVSKYRDLVATQLRVSPFNDVSSAHWAAPYIKTGVDNGLFTGYPGGHFQPDNNVTYEEALTMLLKVLGYTDDDFGASYPYGQLGVAENIGLTEGLSRNVGEAINRYEAAQMIDNALDTKLKDGSKKLLEDFDCKAIENVTIVASNKEDSSVSSKMLVTTGGNFYIDETFDYSLVGRKGKLVIQDGDTFVTLQPEEQIIESYTITGIMGNDLLLNDTLPDIDGKTLTYYKSTASTYSGVISLAKKGDTFTLYKTPDGVIEYAALYPKNQGGDSSSDLLESYTVYSVLDSGLIVYKDGIFKQVKIEDSAVTYMNSQTSLFGTAKAQIELGDILRIKRDSNQDIDYVDIEKGDLKGPVIVRSSDWYKTISGVVPEDYLILRDGAKVSYDQIQVNDIVYYSEDLKMLMAYNKTVTGVYEKATPDKNVPVSVTISGVDYEIETGEVFDALSSNGSYKYGDTITALLGKDGKIAGLISTSQSAEIYGYILETNQKVFTNSDGREYTSYYAKIVGTDGVEKEYQIDNKYSNYKNSVVRLTFVDGVGRLTMVQSSSDSIYGKVDAANYTLGKTDLATNVNILDVTNQQASEPSGYAKVFISRLDGVTLNRNDILLAAKNDKGEISDLILKDVTGDAYSYGLVTEAKSNTSSMSLSGSYVVDINGVKNSVNTVNKTFGVSSGNVVQITMDNGQIAGMRKIDSLNSSVTEVTNSYVMVGYTKYLLSDKAVVYCRDSITTNFLKTPISTLIQNASDYRIEAYYDKDAKFGGRVRVLLATKR